MCLNFNDCVFNTPTCILKKRCYHVSTGISPLEMPVHPKHILTWSCNRKFSKCFIDFLRSYSGGGIDLKREARP